LNPAIAGGAGRIQELFTKQEPNLPMRKAALLSLGMSLFLLGCLHAPDPGVAALPLDPAMATILKPGDLLAIEIAGDADMSGRYPVEWDGTVPLPLIGSIPAAGMTMASFQDELRKRLVAGYFRNPVVSANLVARAPAATAGGAAPPLRQSELSSDTPAPSAGVPELRITSAQ